MAKNKNKTKNTGSKRKVTNSHDTLDSILLFIAPFWNEEHLPLLTGAINQLNEKNTKHVELLFISTDTEKEKQIKNANLSVPYHIISSADKEYASKTRETIHNSSKKYIGILHIEELTETLNLSEIINKPLPSDISGSNEIIIPLSQKDNTSKVTFASKYPLLILSQNIAEYT
ncbi:MAG: hypothetical protein ACOC4B_01570, partial [Bacteroidota bacterium]